VRATWAPRGKTPVLRHRFNWKRASMAAACCYRPEGGGARLVFGIKAGTYDEDSLIAFLGQLHAHLAGEKVTVVWDGLSSHRSKKMKAYVSSQRRWLVVERLPAYAPELNPVETLWANVKGTELANLCAETLDEPIKAARRGAERVGNDQDLLFGFLRAAGLPL
jgi:transposase